MKQLNALFLEQFTTPPAVITPLAGGGGDRKYYRLYTADGRSVVGVIADNTADSRAFVELSEVFSRNGIPVPRVLACSSDYGCYLLEDLGDISLFSILNSESDRVEALVSEVMLLLARMQSIPREEWVGKTAYKPFSRRLIMWDLNYFKYEYLKPSAIAFDEEALEDDFERLADSLMAVPDVLWGFQMRDCQSRNIMLHPSPCFIDYQGGRFGPGIYDPVSFLWQAKAGFDSGFRRRMLDVYAGELASLRGVNAETVLEAADVYALFRTLQVLGAYGFRGLVQKRAHFIESIPGALANLFDLIGRGVADSFPELKRVCLDMCSDPRFAANADDGLNIKVFSFSYKRGYPDDFSGNGGGFMFDCRGMHNPGRYEEYRHLTGRDRPVIEFLRERGEADAFASKAFDMVSPVVERYLQRGFSSLQVGFGCTGGQHRSVYCAEKVARKLADTFPGARVQLIHREQNITEDL